MVSDSLHRNLSSMAERRPQSVWARLCDQVTPFRLTHGGTSVEWLEPLAAFRPAQGGPAAMIGAMLLPRNGVAFEPIAMHLIHRTIHPTLRLLFLAHPSLPRSTSKRWQRKTENASLGEK
jgi:hypothetical protein